VLPSIRVARAALSATLLAALALLAAAPAHAAKPPKGTAPTPVATAPTPSATISRDWGVTLPGVPWGTAELSALAATVGDQPGVVMWYDAWSNQTVFPVEAANRISATGATVTVTWEPWNPAYGVNQKTYSDARIAAGAFDTYVRSYAASVRSYGKPVVIRFAHEMNGNWYPWSPGVNGNTAADYVAAFRHVHDVFAAQGVTNVTWAWVPNIPYTGSVDLPQVYPGDAYVDQVGLDGYNWGTTRTPFWDVFGPGVAQVQALTTRPVWLGEVASAEIGGDKAAWISDMFAALSAHPEVRGFTWFDYNKETDWRIESSPAASTAFTTGLVSYY
jgi:Glycosyl hydrolase family 26